MLDVSHVERSSILWQGKRRQAVECEGTDSQNPEKKRKPNFIDLGTPNETIIIDDDDDDDAPPTIRKGTGTENDPFTFDDWSTGNLISVYENGMQFLVIDDEKEEKTEKVESVIEHHQLTNRCLSSVSICGSLGDGDHDKRIAFDRDDHLPTLRPNSMASSQDKQTSIKKRSHKIPEDEVGTTLACGDERENIIKNNHYSLKNVDCYALSGHSISSNTNSKTTECNSKQSTPDLSLSQETRDSETPVPPLSSEQLLSPTCGLAVDNKQTIDDSTEQHGLSSLLNYEYTHKRSVSFKDPPLPYQTLTIEERKRLFYTIYWKEQQVSLESVMNKHLEYVNGNRNKAKCWLYSGPGSAKSMRSIRATIRFRHNGKFEALSVNLALIALLLEGLLNEEMKEGLIKYSWHASHLCGNFTCVNPYHITMEPGNVNQNRNSCFADQWGPCMHDPSCLKHLKVPLDVLRNKAEDQLLSNGSDDVHYQQANPQLT